MSLAEDQAALLAALTGRGEVPAGFSRARLSAAQRALSCKRTRAVERAWPSITEWLGSSFGARFADYAKAVPLPRIGGPTADGRQFAEWLAKDKALPDKVRTRALRFDLFNQKSKFGYQRRLGPFIRVLWLGEHRQIALALRVPGCLQGRIWVWALPARSNLRD